MDITNNNGDFNEERDRQDFQSEQSQLPIVNYRLSITDRKIMFNHQDFIEKIIPLQDYNALIIFSTGRFMLVNVYTGEIKNELKTELTIKKAELYDDQSIVFFSEEHKKISFFNFVTFKIFNLLNISLPTLAGLPLNERSPQNITDLIRDGVQLTVLRESKIIVVLEVKSQYSPHSNENILSAFHESSPNKELELVRNSDMNQKQFFLEKLNNRDMVCVYVQQFDNAPVEFFLWRIGQNQGVVFRLTDPLSATVQQIFPFGENKAGLLANPNNGYFPILKVFDINEGSKAQEITTILDVKASSSSEATANSDSEEAQKSRAYCLNEVLMTNAEKQFIIWDRLGNSSGCMDIINPYSNRIMFQKLTESCVSDEYEEFEENISTYVASTDCKYLLMYRQKTEPAHQNKITYQFWINSVVEVKTSIMNILLKQNLVQIYGQEACKNVLDMLINSEKATTPL